MTTRRQQAARAIPPRDRPVVALDVSPNRWIREEAELRGWRLVHMWWYSLLPEGITPCGALVEQLPNRGYVIGLRKLGIPVVRMGTLTHPDDNMIPLVMPDQRAEGAVAADHFFERGFHDVGYFGRNPWGDMRPVFEGFRDRAQALDMRCHLFQSDAGGQTESKADKGKRRQHEFIAWLHEIPKPLGLLASGGWHAATECMWAIRAGFTIPTDIAVLAPDANTDICECTMPTISSIERDIERRIRTACDLLERMMAGESMPRSPILIPPKGIVERESTHVRATSDPAVAAALRYMWNHLDLDLSVEQIADEVGMSSRQLRRRFHTALARTINEELRRKRLEEATRLLRSTDLLITDITHRVGFRSTRYLHHAFRQAYGMTPAQWRRQNGPSPGHT